METLEFEVSDPQSGESHVVTNDYVAGQLAQVGYQVLGTSPDGSSVTIQGSQGPYDIDVSQVLGKMGWQVGAMKPVAPQLDVQESWRAMVTTLPDDETKKDLIEAKMRRGGIDNPKVIGSGRDWYVFNPTTASWFAVTNDPKWDLSDLAEAGVTAPRLIASTIGGVAGAAGGPLGAAAGAGLGGAGADIATRAITAGLDPEYKQIASRSLGAMAKDIGGTAAIDAATLGALRGIPALAALTKAGPLSTAARGLGSAAEGLGSVAGSTARFVEKTPFVRETAGVFAPVTGDVAGAGFLARLPAMATTGLARGAGRLGESGVGGAVLGPEGSQALREFSKRLLTRRTPTSLAEEMAARLGGPAVSRQATAADVLRGLSEEVGRGPLGRYMGSRTPEAAAKLKEALRSGYMMGRQFGLAPGEAIKVGREASRDLASEFGRQSLSGVSRGAESFGRGLESLAQAGRGVEQVGMGAFRGGLKATQAGGRGLQFGGKVIKDLGTIGQPLEVPLAAQLGAEEAMRRRRVPALNDILDAKTYLASSY